MDYKEAKRSNNKNLLEFMNTPLFYGKCPQKIYRNDNTMKMSALIKLRIKLINEDKPIKLNKVNDDIEFESDDVSRDGIKHGFWRKFVKHITFTNAKFIEYKIPVHYKTHQYPKYYNRYHNRIPHQPRRNCHRFTRKHIN